MGDQQQQILSKETTNTTENHVNYFCLPFLVPTTNTEGSHDGLTKTIWRTANIILPQIVNCILLTVEHSSNN